MPTAVLLNRDDPTFDFHHAMSHRTFYAIMAPLPRFSAMPYFIEPVPSSGQRPATNWPLSHQRAHDDFANSVPPFYAARRVGFGIPANQNLVDTTSPENRSWWTFTNFQEHFMAELSSQPLPTAAPPQNWFGGATYPFW